MKPAVEEQDLGTRLLTLINNINGMVYRGHRDWSMSVIGAEVEPVTGYTAEEFMTGAVSWKAIIHPDDQGWLKESFRKAVKDQQKTLRVEYRIKHKSGGIRWVADLRQLMYDPAGEFAYVDGLLLDITERKEAERKLLETKAELERSNKELEQFAYSVSHDLRAPLQHIIGFTGMLKEDYAEKLDEKGRHYINRVRIGSEKMQQIINALLKLARFSRSDIHRSKVYLTAFAKADAAELARSHPDRRVEFVIAEEVTADGDPVLIRIVIQNLMENAFKFTGKRAIAKIEFGVKQLNGEEVYFVKDDGVGFDMEHATRLFTPFQRLHTPDEFPGLGIGLATAQRIVHHHGGRIWAESAGHKGATFYFTLK